MDVTSTTPQPGPAVSHLAAAYGNIRTSVLAEAASKLGLSLDQLRSELAAGTPLAAFAVAGVTNAPSEFTLTSEPQGELFDQAL